MPHEQSAWGITMQVSINSCEALSHPFRHRLDRTERDLVATGAHCITKFLRRHRPRNKISLRLVALSPQQKTQLLFRLDTLCDDLDIQSMRHRNDGPHHSGGVGIGPRLLHEAL